MYNYLAKINTPKDLKQLKAEELPPLCGEIRSSLIQRLSVTGGHVGPNLGLVEATVALHYVFDSPKDKFVFDVSHQCYTHKILTGRKAAFLDPDQYHCTSGYTNPEESEHDFFTVGHTSTSISLAVGLAKARDLKGSRENIIAVIGDGSMSGGQAFEGLNNAAVLNSNLIIVFNDNGMSIAENQGGMYQNFALLRETKGKADCNFFKSFGLDYIFVEDGNDLAQLLPAFAQVKDSRRPVVVHICTQKGKGYSLAETHQEQWHWSVPFDTRSGTPSVAFDETDYSDITADFLLEKMQADQTLIAITSATPAVLGFTPDNRKKAGRQFIDVGIAEEHAVALASGIAANGGHPVYGVYSTFLQRTFDQLSQDLCINNNPASIIVYAASIYGMNDVTHLGIYDIPLISNIPNMVYLAPTTREEYLAMLDWSIGQKEHPVAIRVPGGNVVSGDAPAATDFSRLNQYQITQKGSGAAIIALGTFYELGRQSAKLIAEKTGIQPTLINPRFITGIDDKLLAGLKENHSVVITLEDGILDGGFGEKIARFYGLSDMKVLNYGLKKEFLDRYDVNEVLYQNRLTPGQISEDVIKLM